MRSDNDTWDITTSVGSTALFVAAARALEAAKTNPVAVDAFAAVFCRAVGGEWAALLDGSAPDHRLATPWGERFVDYQAARTRFFDDYFTAAAAADIRQIVVLAAGLDSRAYRLRWPARTVVFELDQPRVLEFKRQVLADYGATPRAARVEVPVDLRDDWPRALRDAGFDPSEPSAWIAEGLLIYLPAAAQDELFAGIAALSAPGSEVAVEESTPMDSEAFRAAREEERARGEEGSFFTLVYNEQHRPAAQWFGERGWNATAVPLPALLAELGRPVPAPDSEAGSMISTTSLVRAVKPR
ncbi:MAG: class I SAM-dependent methyltransferase [Mycolicibacterium rufum]|uniref:S-adenosyl-L-methionine-dependent methyltransferase n=1 Tax=Mycolicibacterium chlorophenolicum TaxID=37916 RepID=A0A0J6ZEM4_9MYCO|nr:class I SAM-dependent methyltransferase [Mycolicibacterium chlorophenolicum]KMO83221.1 putative S-adenosyl-L-methionine-dependent methyltransferase [Mycolicibacterium chlorophenolicum]MBI5337757.1 class I SAM-dependent methyltransferase [Mycolicibacterium rufum]